MIRSSGFKSIRFPKNRTNKYISTFEEHDNLLHGGKYQKREFRAKFELPYFIKYARKKGWI